MKTFILSVLTLAYLPTVAHADWTIVVGNNIPGVIDAPIYNYLSLPPTYPIPNAYYGNTPQGLPAGTQTGYGSRLAGWHVGFWFDNGAYFPQDARTMENVGPVLTLDNNGHFPTTTLIFPNPTFPNYTDEQVTTNSPFSLQLRVWDSRLGEDPSSWRVDKGPNEVGASPIYLVFPEQGAQIQSFSLGWLDPVKLIPFVPEPTTSTLALLGAAVVWARKQKTGNKCSLGGSPQE